MFHECPQLLGLCSALGELRKRRGGSDVCWVRPSVEHLEWDVWLWLGGSLSTVVVIAQLGVVPGTRDWHIPRVPLGGTLWVLPQSRAIPFSDVRGVLAGATWKKTSAKTFLVKNKTKCFFMD